MLIILHIFLAISSLILSGFDFLSPSRTKLRISCSLIGLTVISGTYLVIITNSPLLAACSSGLVYLSIVLTATVAARRKLSR